MSRTTQFRILSAAAAAFLLLSSMLLASGCGARRQRALSFSAPECAEYGQDYRPQPEGDTLTPEYPYGISDAA